jgi:ketosteroid isomerase-like protein
MRRLLLRRTGQSRDLSDHHEVSMTRPHRGVFEYGVAVTVVVMVLLVATPRSGGAQAVSDSASALAVVQRFHAALRAGDSSAAVSLLAPDVVVLESGEMEDRAAYLAHHLPADIEFSRAVTEQRDPAHVTIRGDVAWVSSTGRARGKFRERDVNSVSAELMVLVRTSSSGWQIAAIHWSSHRVSP